MQSSSEQPKKRGRPKKDKDWLTPEQGEQLKAKIRKYYDSMEDFYRHAHNKISSYQPAKEPIQIDSIKRGYLKAFAGDGPVGSLYWEALEELLETPRSRLLPRKMSLESGAKSKSQLPSQAAIEVSGENSGIQSMSSRPPFVAISPANASFQKPKQVGSAPPRFLPRVVHYEQMPHLSPFSIAKGTLETHHCLIIRGTKGSGRTTIGYQLAVDYARAHGPVFLWDLADGDTTEKRTSSALELLRSFSETPGLLILDNAPLGLEAASAVYKAWATAPGSASLIIIDLWDPVFTTKPTPYRSCNSLHILDLRYDIGDFIKVYEYWKNDYAPKNGRLLHHKIQPHLFGASVGRLCTGMATCRKVREQIRDRLSVFDSGQLIMDLRGSTQGKPYHTTAEIPEIEEYFRDHPAKRMFSSPINHLKCQIDKGYFTEKSAYILAYSQLSDHPILKWFYVLDPFQSVFQFLVRAHEHFPDVFRSFCEALETDPQFSHRMATRILDPRNNNVDRYIAFAHHLPNKHKADIVECLYNAGPASLSTIRPTPNVSILLKFLQFLHTYLPDGFLQGFAENWTKPGNYRRLQAIIATLVQTKSEILKDATADPMILRMLGDPMLRGIAANPNPFLIKPAFENSGESGQYSSQASCERSDFGSTLERDSLSSALDPEKIPDTPLDAGKGLEADEHVLQPSHSALSILPFLPISPTLPFFRQSDEPHRPIPRFTYQQFSTKQVPKLTAFCEAFAAVQTGSPFIVLRGPKQSGKTTVALQLACRLRNEGFSSIYLDLSAPLPPDQATAAVNVISSLAHLEYCFILDNAQADEAKAVTLQDTWSTYHGKSILILISSWLGGQQSTGVTFQGTSPKTVNVRSTPDDFNEVYRFWQQRSPRPQQLELFPDTFFYMGGALRKFMELLAKNANAALRRDTFVLYDGQNAERKLRGGQSKHNVGAIDRLEKHLRYNPMDRFLFEMKISDVLQELRSPDSPHYPKFAEAFCSLSTHKMARLKLLIDDFASVFVFIACVRKQHPFIFNEYCRSLERIEHFSWSVATRATQPGNGLEYVIWAYLHLPRQHIADIAECFYNFGPKFFNKRVREIREFGALSHLLQFTFEWLPEEFFRRVVQMWSNPEDVQGLRNLMVGRVGVEASDLQQLQASELAGILIKQKRQ